ncbi:MAG TPA: hypothetical protein VKB23_06295 [Solirubrobacterales bacterium]|nr:hypothetical protein [Solirubrobacterales bacterium]
MPKLNWGRRKEISQASFSRELASDSLKHPLQRDDWNSAADRSRLGFRDSGFERCH